jgi:hypothetical protein
MVARWFEAPSFSWRWYFEINFFAAALSLRISLIGTFTHSPFRPFLAISTA